MRRSAIIVLLLVVLGNVATWALVNRPVDERPWSGIITGLALSPFQSDQNPMDGDRPSVADIERDLKTLDGQTKSVRTYSTTNGAELVPALASEHGLTVTAGAWIQGKPEIDEPEIAGLIRLAFLTHDAAGPDPDLRAAHHRGPP